MRDVTKEELETVLVPKEEITDLEEVKKNYLSRIDDYRKKALRYFKARDFQNTLYYLNEIIEIGKHSYDLFMLRHIFHLMALVSIFFDEYGKALVFFK